MCFGTQSNYDKKLINFHNVLFDVYIFIQLRDNAIQTLTIHNTF